MDKEPHSPRQLARKKREALALKANLKRRKEAAQILDKVIVAKDGKEQSFWSVERSDTLSGATKGSV